MSKKFNESVYRILVWVLNFNLNVLREKFEKRINHLHERSSTIVYNDYESSFQKLLELDNLEFELFKVKHGLSNQIISELFDLRNIETFPLEK